jgi:hypothetical protein
MSSFSYLLFLKCGRCSAHADNRGPSRGRSPIWPGTGTLRVGTPSDSEFPIPIGGPRPEIRACCTHTRRVSPISRFAASRVPFPVSRPNHRSGFGKFDGNGGFPIPMIPAELVCTRVGNRGFPPSPPFPRQIGSGGNGNWGFPGLQCHGLLLKPQGPLGSWSSAEIQAPWHAAAEQQLSSCQHEPVTRSSSLRLPLSLSHRSGRRLASSRCTQPGGVRPPGNKPLSASRATGGPFTALPRKPPIPTGIVSAQTPDTAWTGPPEPSQESCMVFHTASRPFA